MEEIKALESSIAVNVTRADKGVAVRFILDQLGIDEEAVLVIGDSALDDPMYKELLKATRIYLGEKPYEGLGADVIRFPVSGYLGGDLVLKIVNQNDFAALTTSKNLYEVRLGKTNIKLQKEIEEKEKDANIGQVQGFSLINEEDYAQVGSLELLRKQDTINAASDGTLAANKGGIDLNPDNIDIQINKEGSKIQFPSFEKIIELESIKGFKPILLEVTPMSNIPQFLGIQ